MFNKVTLLLSSAVLMLLVSGCYFPEQPNFNQLFKIIDERPTFTIYHSGIHDQWPLGRSVIFLAADDLVQNAYKDQISKIYNNPNIRLEDITWWKFAPQFARLYDQVIVLNYSQVRYKNLMDAIAYAESQYGVYDIFILSHGLPNHLTTGGRGYFLSWKELQAMKGQLKKLNLVFMQACYGLSLLHDWFDAGAKVVIGYEDLNRNFFYIDYFLEYYDQYHYNYRKAHNRATYEMARKLEHDVVAKRIIGAMGYSLEDYLQVAKDPFLFSDLNGY